MHSEASTLVATAEAAWRWVRDQAQWDADGPWVPEAVPLDGPAGREPPDLRTGLHSGTGGLALVLAEVRLARPWTDGEHDLAVAIADQLRRQTPSATEVPFFDGLVSNLTVLLALEGSATQVPSPSAHRSAWRPDR